VSEGCGKPRVSQTGVGVARKGSISCPAPFFYFLRANQFGRIYPPILPCPKQLFCHIVHSFRGPIDAEFDSCGEDRAFKLGFNLRLVLVRAKILAIFHIAVGAVPVGGCVTILYPYGLAAVGDEKLEVESISKGVVDLSFASTNIRSPEASFKFFNSVMLFTILLCKNVSNF